MKKGLRQAVASILFIALLITTFLPIIPAKEAMAADEFDQLRNKYKDMITGGDDYDLSNSYISSKITSITATAKSHWDSMNKSTTRTKLWNDLDGKTDDNHIREEYIRMLALARAYQTFGSSLYQNTQLKIDIIAALDWLYTNHFNESITRFGNWYNWEISVPEKLNTITVLMYDDLTNTQINNYMNAIQKFKPTIFRTGSNRVWECTITVVRGIIIKSASEVNRGKNELSPVFDYVTTSDGFYTDGSFIQHDNYAYQGEYGRLLLSNIMTVMELLAGSTYAITDPDSNNIFSWIKDSFAPLLYKGQLMSMVYGRTIAYAGSYSDNRNEHTIGHDVMRSILLASTFANQSDSLLFKSMLKYWIEEDTYADFMQTSGLRIITLASDILDDVTVQAMDEPEFHKRYTASDRVVHAKEGYALGLSMYSKRIANYESINNENLHGWYTGAGATYLYNNDLSQYSNDFWATVNPYRIPGTTVDTAVLSDAQYAKTVSGRSYVGGTDILSQYGVSAMHLTDVGTGLDAKKSWFMFDDEIVALGAGITSTSNRTIETIIDNKKINGANTLTVNGVVKSSNIGWSETMPAVSTIHMEGNTSTGSDIGYYFPNSITIKGTREERTGSWYDIYKNGVIDSFRTQLLSRKYLTLWQDHGKNPSDGKYRYVILPNKTSNEVTSYSQNPDITVLANTQDIQAVKENKLNIVAANFWQDTVQTIDMITSNRKSSIMTHESQDGIEVSVSDPTQVSGSPTIVEINRSATKVITSDPGITVLQLNPTIKFSVNVQGSKGKTFNIKLAYATQTINPSDDTYVQDGVNANSNYGTTSKLVIKSILEDTDYKRKSYMKYDFSTYSENTISNAKLRLYVSEVNTDPVRVIKLYGISDVTWNESTLTWNNAPTVATYLGSIDVSNIMNTWYEYDVTNYINSKFAGKKVSFLLVNEGAASSKGNVAFASKEAAVGTRPELLLTK